MCICVRNVRSDYMTNGDRIRQMSNEELAEMLNGNCSYCRWGLELNSKCETSCKEGIKAYLESEVE